MDVKVVRLQKVAFKVYPKGVKNVWKGGGRGWLLGRQNLRGKGPDKTCNV